MVVGVPTIFTIYPAKVCTKRGSNAQGMKTNPDEPRHYLRGADHIIEGISGFQGTRGSQMLVTLCPLFA